ncbi:UPF0146 family protein [Halovivax gelatinilyticus]|uniref:UPF0146 family protein n=1 Tax=Halovivax gelatinilyticus TaxID=2961597 RepID=UPI0020CA72BA|nr:UPF0146 family protein [Halovivax gelatinilyticus]
MTRTDRVDPIFIERLARYDRLVEVGIGRRVDLAAALVDAGARVVATDVYDRAVPEGVTFVRDDVVDPDPSVYADADAIYAQNLPPELHRPTADLAESANAAFLFTTLGADQPAIPVERVTIETGSLYVRSRSSGPNR